MENEIAIRCPECTEEFSCHESEIGELARCPLCDQYFVWRPEAELPISKTTNVNCTPEAEQEKALSTGKDKRNFKIMIYIILGIITVCCAPILGKEKAAEVALGTIMVIAGAMLVKLIASITKKGIKAHWDSP